MLQVTKELLHDQENVIVKECLVNFQPLCVFLRQALTRIELLIIANIY